ncbi:hypothetical protein K7X08_005004 [Anisodus acutangulus]|uniref:Uncharacterized protein n=1 Tax=Anisodus acutangulus TaxID=402998 RepID=A0A9Q1RG37_9SOLA|nr:hypothetical protein K7X08_005004 [Anisodus acutangulus]
MIGEVDLDVFTRSLQKNGQTVAVKQLDRNGLQGNRESLVEAEPIFKDTRRHIELADPLLEANFPKKCFSQAVAIASMCLQEDPVVRPLISDVVTALAPFQHLTSQNWIHHSLLQLEHHPKCKCQLKTK